MMRVLQSAVSLWEAFWSRESSANIDTPERKVKLERRVFDLLSSIKDADVRKQYQLKARVELVDLFRKSIQKPGFVRHGTGQTDRRAPFEGASGQLTELRTTPTFSNDNSAPIRDEMILLGLSIEYPAIFEDFIESIIGTDLHGSTSGISHEHFKREIYDAVSNEGIYGALKPSDFYNLLSDRFFVALDALHGRGDPSNRIEQGHNFFRRFPLMKILRTDPGQAMIVIPRMFRFLLSKLQLHEAKKELGLIPQRMTLDNADAELERAWHLRCDVNEKEEELTRLEVELDEMVAAIRGIGQSPPGLRTGEALAGEASPW
jgi:hypothetical protein